MTEDMTRLQGACIPTRQCEYVQIKTIVCHRKHLELLSMHDDIVGYSYRHPC